MVAKGKFKISFYTWIAFINEQNWKQKGTGKKGGFVLYPTLYILYIFLKQIHFLKNREL